MPSISVLAVGISDPPPFIEVADRVRFHSADDHWTLAVINDGMSNGDPSIAIVVDHDGVVVVVETSLAAFAAAADSARLLAAARFGWAGNDTAIALRIHTEDPGN